MYLFIYFPNTDNVIKQRKESLKQDTELEKVKQKRHLDFLDILLYAKVPNLIWNDHLIYSRWYNHHPLFWQYKLYPLLWIMCKILLDCQTRVIEKEMWVACLLVILQILFYIYIFFCYNANPLASKLTHEQVCKVWYTFLFWGQCLRISWSQRSTSQPGNQYFQKKKKQFFFSPREHCKNSII